MKHLRTMELWEGRAFSQAQRRWSRAAEGTAQVGRDQIRRIEVELAGALAQLEADPDVSPAERSLCLELAALTRSWLEYARANAAAAEAGRAAYRRRAQVAAQRQAVGRAS